MNIAEKNGDKPIHVFLSHSRGDKTYADQIIRLLSRRHDVRLFDPSELSAGEDWRSKLKGELESCDLFMVLLSPDSVTSSWVLQESGAAWALEKPIVPIVTRPEVTALIPSPLKDFASVNINDLLDQATLEQVLKRSQTKQ